MLPVEIEAEEASCVVGVENKAALAYVVRAEEAASVVGRLVMYRGIEPISKHIWDSRSQAPHCWQKVL